MERLLIALAGARLDILDRVPTERAKFAALGSVVLLSSVVAGVSMVLALVVTGFNLFLALPIALLWGLVILGINRWMTVSLPVGVGRRWVSAIPRVTLAVLFGSLVATPVDLFIFRHEIAAQLSATHALQPHGLLTQLSALDEITEHNPGLNVARFLLSAIVVVIELLPIALKLLQRPGIYEDVIKMARASERRAAQWELRGQGPASASSRITPVDVFDKPGGSPIDLTGTTLEDLFLRLGPPREEQRADQAREGNGGADQ